MNDVTTGADAARRVRAKICGVITVADAVGLVFAAASGRRIAADRGAEIARALPPFVARVALFAGNEAAEIAAVLAAVPVDWLQFHGDETPAFCRSFGRPYIKAVPMGEPNLNLADWAARYADAAALLLDAHRADQVGGQGRPFDWSQALDDVAQPIIVAGGLDAGNVAAAIARFRPYAVDVSSGVESARGVKSARKMNAFMNAVIQAGNP